MMTEAQRRAHARYEKKRRGVYSNVACRLKAEDANAFKNACSENGTTPNAVLSRAIQRYMSKRG